MLAYPAPSRVSGGDNGYHFLEYTCSLPSASQAGARLGACVVAQAGPLKPEIPGPRAAPDSPRHAGSGLRCRLHGPPELTSSPSSSCTTIPSVAFTARSVVPRCLVSSSAHSQCEFPDSGLRLACEGRSSWLGHHHVFST